jgi:hypothetical protein
MTSLPQPMAAYRSRILSAAMSSAIASSEATQRTWFHAIQPVTNPGQNDAASGRIVSHASVPFSGTLNPSATASEPIR